jgi:hypothetical protein
VATTAVNHLLFADDSMMFLMASTEGATEVKWVLEKYCNASGQRINMYKSSIFFGKDCIAVIREGIKAELDVECKTLNEKYLSLPSDVGRSKSGALNVSRIEYGRRCWDGWNNYYQWAARRF